MKKEIKLRTWIELFEKGVFDEYNVETQCNAGWYDWFCKDTSLRNKTIKMGKVVKKIKDGGKINLDKTYVFFKNNCPLNGPLFDDFRICDIETGDVLFTIQFSCCWNKKRYGVCARKIGFDKLAFETDSVKELAKWLNQPWEA